MNFIAKINTTTKIIILVLYTCLLAVAAGCIIVKVEKTEEFKEYTDQAFDENIEVGVSLLEHRSRSNPDNETSREEAKWDVRVHLNARDTSKKFKNIHTYLTIKTEAGNHVYKEKINKNNVTMPYINFLSEYSITNKTQKQNSETKVYENIDKSPVCGFLKVHYQVGVTKLDGTTEYKDYELNYRFDVIKFEEKDLSKYIDTTVSDDKDKRINLKDDNELFGLSIKTKLSNNKRDNFNIYTYYSKEKVGASGIEIKDSHLAIFGKLENDPHDDTNYISNYVTMVQYHGILTTRTTGITLTSSTVSFSEDYNLSEVYVISSMKTVPGKVVSSYVKIPVENLPTVE